MRNSRRFFAFLLGLTVLASAAPLHVRATTFQLEVDSPSTLTIRCFPDNSYQNEDYLFLFLELKQALDRLENPALHTTILTSDNPAEPPRLVLRITNIALLQDTLNFFDYSYSRSFYQEKYNLRLILNARLFQSGLFRQLAGQGFSFRRFRPLFGKENLVFLISLPGHCQETNLERYNDSYYISVPQSLFLAEGKIVYLETAHFFPEIYGTVLLGMLLAVFILVRSLWKKSNLSKNNGPIFPPRTRK